MGLPCSKPKLESDFADYSNSISTCTSYSDLSASTSQSDLKRISSQVIATVTVPIVYEEEEFETFLSNEDMLKVRMSPVEKMNELIGDLSKALSDNKSIIGPLDALVDATRKESYLKILLQKNLHVIAIELLFSAVKVEEKDRTMALLLRFALPFSHRRTLCIDRFFEGLIDLIREFSSSNEELVSKCFLMLSTLSEVEPDMTFNDHKELELLYDVIISNRKSSGIVKNGIILFVSLIRRCEDFEMVRSLDLIPIAEDALDRFPNNIAMRRWCNQLISLVQMTQIELTFNRKELLLKGTERIRRGSFEVM
ncbi:hypothetical protein PCE1_000524 [Barthelona sp. PCE]